MLTETVKGMPIAEGRRIAGAFIDVIRGQKEPALLDEMGDLAAFKGVIRFPMRVKCATLAWHALLVSLPAAAD
jgi:nitrogen fixation NifU-like protein